MYHNGEDISAYLDGELSAEQARELEQELATDPEARAELHRLRGVRNALTSVEHPDFEPGQRRVWMMLENRLQLRPPLWRRRISVPYPAAAAAALAVLVLAGLLAWFAAGVDTAEVTAVESADAEVQVAIGGVDGEELLRWLNDDETIDEVSVKLPETPQFRIMGKPQLLKAAELHSHGEP